MKIALLDYGAGNLHSLGKALAGAGAEIDVTADWSRALSADALVLPGVGAFGAVVQALPPDPGHVRERLAEGLPCLGICLGMQVLFDESEEAPGAGLGVLAGRVRKLRAARVPHIGWNDVVRTEAGRCDPVLADSEHELEPVYFANSYVCELEDPDSVLAWTEVGGDRFPSAVRVGNTWGVQFHPEKSSDAGLALIRRFVAQVGQATAEGGS